MALLTKIIDWFKAASKIKLIKDILASVSDGEISKEELAQIIADIKELVAKK